MGRNKTDTIRASKIRHLHQQVQELSRDIDDANDWHEVLLHRLQVVVHGRGGVWAALRYSLPQQSRTKTSAIATIPDVPHNCRPNESGGAIKEAHSEDNANATKQPEQEKTFGKVLATESAATADTDTTEPARKGRATHHRGASSVITFGDFSNMDASSKRDRVRQGIILKEDKIRSILSGMKERMVTADKKDNQTVIDFDSDSI
jgi:hypothetical protein